VGRISGRWGRARWEMGEILKMKRENGDIRVLNLLIAFFLFKKKLTRGKETDERLMKAACVEALV